MKKIIYLTLGFMFLTSALMAGPNGKITGYVKDKGTGEALPGVNVIIDGTTMGAASNAKGEFSIINVPAGVYTLKASMIGYSKTTKQNIRVLPDFTTKVDFDLIEESVSGEEVVIIAERPLIQKDQTMTMSVTSSEEIKTLPVRGFQAVANLGTGITIDVGTRNLEGGTGNVNVRGGRASETGVYLDGFLQNNLLTGVSNVQVSNSAVEEILMITGGFNAEYGRNQSGIMQIITKGGRTKYSGNVEYVTDMAAKGFFTESYGYNNISAGFGGPLIPGNNKIKFFVSGEGQIFDDAEPGVFGIPKFRVDTTGTAGDTRFEQLGLDNRYRNDWGRDTVLMEGWDPDNGIYNTKWKKGPRPNNSRGEGSNGFTYGTVQGKMTFSITDNFKLDVSGNLGKNIRRAYGNTRLFSPDHVTRIESFYWQAGGVGTYTFNPNSFLEVGANYNFNRRRQMDDKFGWNINWPIDNLGSTAIPSYRNENLYLNPGRANAAWTQDFDTYIATKVSYTNQIDKNHLVKAGVDFYRHTIRLMEMNNLTQDPIYGANNFVGYRIGYIAPSPSDPTGHYYIRNQNKDDFDRDTKFGRVPLDGAKHPISFSAFLQDKMEYEGLILNLGVRYDLFNAGAKRIKDFYNPLGTPGVDTVFQVGSEDYTNAKSDHKISPRVSISFPVSEKTVFRASYGKFFQQPNLNNLYIGGFWYSQMVLQPPFAADVQNPNLKAEESTQYEVGMQRALTDNLKIDISAYYKDINNLINLENSESNPQAGYYALILYGNHDRGVVKGVVFSLDLRRTSKISSRLAYTLQWANGTGSGDASGFRSAWLGYQSTKFNAPLNFDRRHNLNATLDIRNASKEGPAWGGYLLQNAGVNFLLTTSSGLPYTPVTATAISDGTPSGRVTARRNSQYGPWTFRVDLKADKTFDLPYGMNLQLYVQIMNVLNTKNAVVVNPASGSADDDGWRSTATGSQYIATRPIYNAFYNMRMKNSFFYDTPRQARIGAALSF